MGQQLAQFCSSLPGPDFIPNPDSIRAFVQRSVTPVMTKTTGTVSLTSLLQLVASGDSNEKHQRTGRRRRYWHSSVMCLVSSHYFTHYHISYESSSCCSNPAQIHSLNWKEDATTLFNLWPTEGRWSLGDEIIFFISIISLKLSFSNHFSFLCFFLLLSP